VKIRFYWSFELWVRDEKELELILALRNVSEKFHSQMKAWEDNQSASSSLLQGS